MINCPVCGSKEIKKNGMISKQIMYKAGKRTKKFQAYRCNQGHRFKVVSGTRWSDAFIEYVVWIYLRCLSFNVTVDIIRATYEDDLLSKSEVLRFVEWVADALPTLDDIDRLYSPYRSGYLAFDGVWFKFTGEEIVLLVCFDPVSFDVIGALWSEQETSASYGKLMSQVLEKIPKDHIKGVYGDGDNGLILSLKRHFPRVPFQLCSVHKYMRMAQTVPVHSVYRSRKLSEKDKQEIVEFAQLFHSTLYADTREIAVEALRQLMIWTHHHPQPRFIKAVNRLKRNFQYTLTHFDYPGMHQDNNLIECFNGCIKPRLKLMKGFKKKDNLNRYLKLFLLDFRFHPLKESRFNYRRGLSPLRLGGITLPKYYNFLSLLRSQLNLKYHPKNP